MRIYYSLYGRLLSLKTLLQAYKKVRRANGAAGIDRQSVEAFGENLDINLEQLLQELKTKTYQASPVRRVEIPKDDGGVRLLGIPTVRDRIVQQAVTDVLTPLFDPDFHPSSYGYRPKRSSHDAINKATLFIREHKLDHVVDMDLSKCFDRLDHEFIIAQVRKRVVDGSILSLIRQFLTSGVMQDGSVTETHIGSPQGGVISPLLANIYLDVFDQEMMKRKYRIVRYADDILIFCRTQKEAEDALKASTKILEEDLKLTVNKEKTHLTHSDQWVKFLGVEIGTHYTRVQKKKLQGFKAKVKALTKRNGGKPLKRVIEDVNPLLRGFSQYFRIADTQKVRQQLAQWIRRRLRSVQLALWKTPSRLRRRLRQIKYTGPILAVSMQKWNSSRCPAVHHAMPVKWFNELKLFDMELVKSTSYAAQKRRATESA